MALALVGFSKNAKYDLSSEARVILIVVFGNSLVHLFHSKHAFACINSTEKCRIL